MIWLGAYAAQSNSLISMRAGMASRHPCGRQPVGPERIQRSHASGRHHRTTAGRPPVSVGCLFAPPSPPTSTTLAPLTPDFFQTPQAPEASPCPLSSPLLAMKASTQPAAVIASSRQRRLISFSQRLRELLRCLQSCTSTCRPQRVARSLTCLVSCVSGRDWLCESVAGAGTQSASSASCRWVPQSLPLSDAARFHSKVWCDVVSQPADCLSQAPQPRQPVSPATVHAVAGEPVLLGAHVLRAAHAAQAGAGALRGSRHLPVR